MTEPAGLPHTDPLFAQVVDLLLFARLVPLRPGLETTALVSKLANQLDRKFEDRGATVRLIRRLRRRLAEESQVN